MNEDTKPAVTEWFPGHIKPVRVGVYQLESGSRNEIGYQLWDGKGWGFWCRSPAEAERDAGQYAADDFQNDRWRGLASDPAKVQAKPMRDKAARVRDLVNAGPLPGMSEAFDAYIGTTAWAHPAWKDEAALWAAAWRAAVARTTTEI